MVIESGNGTYKAIILKDEKNEVSKCVMSADKSNWRISAWYTKEECFGQGLGKKCMKELVHHIYSILGRPECIEYIWNGQNDYVYEWMERHFSPVSKCPIIVQKYQAEDDWDSHVYKLDVNAFLKYFEVAI